MFPAGPKRRVRGAFMLPALRQTCRFTSTALHPREPSDQLCNSELVGLSGLQALFKPLREGLYSCDLACNTTKCGSEYLPVKQLF